LSFYTKGLPLRSTVEQAIKSIHRTGNTIDAVINIPSSAPIFTGHFPGKPLVPAVYQMALCTTAVAKYYDGKFIQVRRSRFLAPCVPDVCYNVIISIEDAAASFVAGCAIRQGTVIHSKIVLSYEKPAFQD
jgi:3-hydroxymyristoyl/3-hydroxydecanoyl-(acyl carrier protein) dehydratase